MLLALQPRSLDGRAQTGLFFDRTDSSRLVGDPMCDVAALVEASTRECWRSGVNPTFGDAFGATLQKPQETLQIRPARDDIRGAIAVMKLWAVTGSNRRPPACMAGNRPQGPRLRGHS